jgi:hypothetical protein
VVYLAFGDMSELDTALSAVQLSRVNTLACFDKIGNLVFYITFDQKSLYTIVKLTVDASAIHGTAGLYVFPVVPMTSNMVFDATLTKGKPYAVLRDTLSGATRDVLGFQYNTFGVHHVNVRLGDFPVVSMHPVLVHALHKVYCYRRSDVYMCAAGKAVTDLNYKVPLPEFKEEDIRKAAQAAAHEEEEEDIRKAAQAAADDFSTEVYDDFQLSDL